jgi:hypothetical protein
MHGATGDAYFLRVFDVLAPSPRGKATKGFLTLVKPTEPGECIRLVTTTDLVKAKVLRTGSRLFQIHFINLVGL